MANNENTVQIQVEVLRAQLDKLIADINSLKNQKISVKVDTAGAAALEQLSDAVQQICASPRLRRKLKFHHCPPETRFNSLQIIPG